MKTAATTEPTKRRGSTFDYRRAWHEVAKPAYESLPANLRDLLDYTAKATAGVHQSADLSMPWPDMDSEYRDLRERFDKTPAEWLSQAAAAIYFVGHWYPADGDIAIPGRQAGAHWKFSHYADQSLRARLGIATNDGFGVSLQIIEGSIRICYSSREMWTWHEVSPATEGGKTHALNLASELRGRTLLSKTSQERDHVAWIFMEALKDDRSGWLPGTWGARFDISAYMVDESEIVSIGARLDAPELSTIRARIIKHADGKIAALIAERGGKLWLVDRGFNVDNVIYYGHTGRFCFGWRDPLTDDAISRWLDVLAEFPYAYDLKGYEAYRDWRKF